jgi:chaperonin GroES
MKVRPLYDRILVKRVAEEETTKGGIIIPDSAKEKPIEGKVVAVGNGKLLENGELRPVAVKKGERILFGKYSRHRDQDRGRRASDPARGRSPRRRRVSEGEKRTRWHQSKLVSTKRHAPRFSTASTCLPTP